MRASNEVLHQDQNATQKLIQQNVDSGKAVGGAQRFCRFKSYHYQLLVYDLNVMSNGALFNLERRSQKKSTL